MNKTVIITVAGLCIVVLILFQFSGGDGKIDCYTNPDSIWFMPDISPEECDMHKQGFQLRKDHINKLGKEIGCDYYEQRYCKVGYKTYTLVSYFTLATATVQSGELFNMGISYQWAETEYSQLCAKYYQSKISELPVFCLDYYGLREGEK